MSDDEYKSGNLLVSSGERQGDSCFVKVGAGTDYAGYQMNYSRSIIASWLPMRFVAQDAMNRSLHPLLQSNMTFVLFFPVLMNYQAE